MKNTKLTWPDVDEERSGAAPRRRSIRGAHLLALSAMAALVAMACESSQTAKIGQTNDALDQTVLGTAQSFAVLGASTVTNTGATTVYGNLGVDPGLAVSGFPPGLVTGGTIHSGDAVALQAQNDTTTAYNSLAGMAPTGDLTGQDLGGMTLTPGVYHFSSSAQLTGALTLNAQGDPNAVFVFQIGSTLTTASNSSVLMINGGRDCNAFWQIGSSATLGTTTTFKGNILALTSITLNTGAIVSGRALARNAAVTMDTNDVSILSCAAAADAGADAGGGGPSDSGGDAGQGNGGDGGIGPNDGATAIDAGSGDAKHELDASDVDACEAGDANGY